MLLFSPRTIAFLTSKNLNISSAFVPYDCEMWSLTLKEGCYPEVNIGPRKHENGKWRKIHSEELHSLYHSSNIPGVCIGLFRVF